MKKLICGLIVAATSLPALAVPAINIGSMHDFIEPGQSTLLKRIRNTGDSTAFVRVTVTEIVFDTSGNATEKSLNADGIMKSQAEGVVATPARMIVPAGGVQANRQLYIGKRDRERYYRVRYVPVMPKDAAEFGQSEQEMKRYEKSLNAGVTMLSGYGAILTVRPDTVRYDTQQRHDTSGYVITNKGNSTVTLDNLYQCDATGKKCQTPSVRYLTPGKSLRLEKSAGRSYKFDLIEGQSKKAISIGKL
ncbi:hypothetical protein [Buttiauxella gaviniae]|uniref:hypothetical protein n=1 Tax=Buttiauxella gaviniae TaxID=82990 RepID=UPI003975C7F5